MPTTPSGCGRSSTLRRQEHEGGLALFGLHPVAKVRLGVLDGAEHDEHLRRPCSRGETGCRSRARWRRRSRSCARAPRARASRAMRCAPRSWARRSCAAPPSSGAARRPQASDCARGELAVEAALRLSVMVGEDRTLRWALQDTRASTLRACTFEPLTRDPQVEAAVEGGPQIPGRPSGAAAALAPAPRAGVRRPAAGAAAIAQALASGGARGASRHTGPELVAFVRAHLVHTLTRADRAAADDGAARRPRRKSWTRTPADASSDVQEPAAPAVRRMPRPTRARSRRRPGSSPRVRSGASSVVLLVDADRVGADGRSRARSCARSGTSRSWTRAAEMASALRGGRADRRGARRRAPRRGARRFSTSSRARTRPDVAVVIARARTRARIAGAARRLGIARFDVRSHDAPAEELRRGARRRALESLRTASVRCVRCASCSCVVACWRATGAPAGCSSAGGFGGAGSERVGRRPAGAPCGELGCMQFDIAAGGVSRSAHGGRSRA